MVFSFYKCIVFHALDLRQLIIFKLCSLLLQLILNHFAFCDLEIQPLFKMLYLAIF